MQNGSDSGRGNIRMKNKITHNLGLKLLSVAFAFILWLVVVNINDPDITKTIRNISITILNESAITEQGTGQVYTIKENKTAAIVVKGPRSVVDDMDRNDVIATADFSEVSSVGAVPINIVSLPSGVTLKDELTENMKLAIEPLVTKRFAVSAETTGIPADGYVTGAIEISPNVVSVKAPQSVLETIEKVVTYIDVDGMSTDVTGKSVSVLLLDAEGNSISYEEGKNITLSTETLVAEADILKCQNVPVNLAVRGYVAEGYRYTGMEQSLAEVTIKGTKEAIAAAKAVDLTEQTAALNLTGLTENTEKSVDILPYLPQGTELLDESQRYITVTLKVEELKQKTMSVSPEDLHVLNMPENMTIEYQITPDAMIEVEGLLIDLEEVTLADLHPTIDLEGLEAGTHICAVSVTVPENLSVTWQARVVVILTEKVSEEETTQTSAEVSTMGTTDR